MSTDITTTHEWKDLEAHQAEISETNLRELFADDPERANRFTFDAAGLHVDLSKNLISQQTVEKLVALARAAGLKEKIEDMFTGTHINNTEDRAVLHTALRIPAEDDLSVDGQDVAADVHEVLGRMRDFASALRSGEWLGGGQALRRCVHQRGKGGRIRHRYK